MCSDNDSVEVLDLPVQSHTVPNTQQHELFIRLELQDLDTPRKTVEMKDTSVHS